MKVYRQGDVLLLGPSPADLTNHKEIPAVAGRTVLQHGTATGHNHAITSPSATLWRNETPTEGPLQADRILRLTASAVLEHDEHDPIGLEAGDWIVRIQHEYRPETLINVAD